MAQALVEGQVEFDTSPRLHLCNPLGHEDVEHLLHACQDCRFVPVRLNEALVVLPVAKSLQMRLQDIAKCVVIQSCPHPKWGKQLHCGAISTIEYNASSLRLGYLGEPSHDVVKWTLTIYKAPKDRPENRFEDVPLEMRYDLAMGISEKL
jgi:hypothetical protein